MIYDIIILGAGTAGMAASIYGARFGLSTLIIGEEVGGTINETDAIENYPGFIKISGSELAERFKEQVKAVGGEIKIERIKDLKKEKERFFVITDSGKYEGKTILFALGARHKKLGVKGEEEFASRGVSYCPTCDAAFFKRKRVAVIGGGDGAAYAANLLSNFADKVFVIVRKDKMRAEPINLNRIINNHKIEIIYNTNVVEILGDKSVNKVKIDKPFKGSNFIELEGVFVMIGHIPNTELAEKIGLRLNERKEIIINENSETNIPGVYAAGDCADKPFKQIITGAAEGVKAAFSAYRYLGE